MADSYPLIARHFACKVGDHIYFYFEFDKSNCNYGEEGDGGWIAQIKINDESIADEDGFDYVLSPYVWSDPTDPNSSTLPLVDSLSFRNTVDNGWVSESLKIIKLRESIHYLALSLPVSLLRPSIGVLNYDLWILSTGPGNPMQSSFKGSVISVWD